MQALRGYKIALLLLLAASQALSFIDRVNLSVVLPEVIKQNVYSASAAGFLMSILNWFYVGAIILAGPLTDKIGARRAFPGAVALWSLATALCGLTVQFWPLAALRALVGIGEAPNIPSASQVIRQNFGKTERGFAGGVSPQPVRPPVGILRDGTTGSDMGIGLAADLSPAKRCRRGGRGQPAI